MHPMRSALHFNRQPCVRCGCQKQPRRQQQQQPGLTGAGRFSFLTAWLCCPITLRKACKYEKIYGPEFHWKLHPRAGQAAALQQLTQRVVAISGHTVRLLAPARGTARQAADLEPAPAESATQVGVPGTEPSCSSPLRRKGRIEAIRGMPVGTACLDIAAVHILFLLC